MRPITTTVGPLATASATNIRTSSAVAAGGAITLNGTLVVGGVGILDTPRRVLLTTTGDNTGGGKIITLSGTNGSGNAISETILLIGATTYQSVLDYKTVSASASAAIVGNLSIGTNGVASSPWVRLDPWALPNVGVQLDVTGTVNYDLQQTMDDPNDPTSPVAPGDMTWIASADTNVVGATASKQTNYLFTPIFARILLNSGTGSVAGKFVQSGVVPV